MSKVKHSIAVSPRKEFGKNASRRYRAAGQVPVNVYAAGKENMAFTVAAGDWEALSQNELHLIYLEDKENGREIPVMVKEVQFNYLKNSAVHLDFQAIDENAEISSEIAIHPVGECIGAQRGGVLSQETHHIVVTCKPTELPEHLTADVSNLEVGESMLAKDIVLPANVKLHSDPEAVIFHVVLPTEEPVEEEAAAAEGEAAPAEENK